ncbi:hypothetical protein [Streptomyces sp. NPDC048527]|uniref:hypothetical protein n=1 Tax=Streptomyces sp. NPDC048527 TaxID=3365568 RepID=UPI00371ED534
MVLWATEFIWAQRVLSCPGCRVTEATPVCGASRRVPRSELRRSQAICTATAFSCPGILAVERRTRCVQQRPDPLLRP